MTMIAIAALHCLFPIIGALLGKGRGLQIGTAVGVIAAPILGSIVFTIPDLIGVGLGYFIGKGLIGNDTNQTDFADVWENICDSLENAVVFLKKVFIIGLSVVSVGFLLNSYMDISRENDAKIEKREAEKRKIQNTPKEEFYDACYFHDDAEACNKYARKFAIDSENFFEGLKRACSLNHRDSCTNLTVRLILSGQYKEAKNYIPLMCRLSESDCAQIAYILKQYNNEEERKLGILTFKEVIHAYPNSKYTESYKKSLSELQQFRGDFRKPNPLVSKGY